MKFGLENFEERSTRPVHSHLSKLDATRYHHLGAGSNDTSACEISQAHPADVLNISKFINITRNNSRIKILKPPSDRWRNFWFFGTKNKKKMIFFTKISEHVHFNTFKTLRTYYEKIIKEVENFISLLGSLMSWRVSAAKKFDFLV